MPPERLARKVIYESPWVNLYADTVRFPNGRIIDEHHLVDIPRQAVAAVIEDHLGRVVFVRVCRYTTGLSEWELPAGRIEPGETVEAAALREILEETGVQAGELHLLYRYYPLDGISNAVFHIVAGKALAQGERLDRDEVDETCWLTPPEIRQRIQDRRVIDGLSLTALLLWLKPANETGTDGGTLFRSDER
jgi:ADP-ribose pyrophosphatase